MVRFMFLPLFLVIYLWSLRRLDLVVSLGYRLVCVFILRHAGTFKTLHVDAYTFARDVELMLVHKLNITLSSPFALYEASSTEQNGMVCTLYFQDKAFGAPLFLMFFSAYSFCSC